MSQIEYIIEALEKFDQADQPVEVIYSVECKRKKTKGQVVVDGGILDGRVILYFEMDDELMSMSDEEIEARITNFLDPDYDFASDPDYHDLEEA